MTVVSLFWIGSIRSFGLTQKNQKVKAAPSGLLRIAAGGKWMKLASLKQHPFLFRPPRRSASRPSAEAGPFLPIWTVLALRLVPFLLAGSYSFGHIAAYPSLNPSC